MKKRNGVITIILMIAVTALMLYTALVGWGSGNIGSMQNIKTGLDLSGGVSITYEANEANPSSEDMEDTVYKLQQRVTQYSTEANVYQEGSNRINVEIPGVSDANEILEDLGTPGSLYFISQTDADGNENYSYSTDGTYVLNKTIEELEAEGSIVLTGSDVESAEGVVSTDSTTSTTEYVVDLTFTSEGTEKFAEATTLAYAQGESIGIYYDGEFISVPTVQAAITDGNAQITGMSDIEEARELASYIRIGGLSLTLNEIRSNVVGAQLGEEAIRTSLTGGAIGLCIVMVIMIAVYMVPGLIASVALVLYAALMMILLNAFDLTLTLPGIAGIILGIGMAVDANVIIYSRLQEEITNGTSVRGAIEAGFHKAMSAIIDGNITTLIAAAVLGVLGTGTIQGFAMTLALGVVVSMFTALVISRFLVRAVYAVGVKNPKVWARKKRYTRFHFAQKWLRYVIVAVVVICVGLGSMVYHSTQGERALNFSLEFLGGTATTVEFNEDYSLAELDETVKPVVSEITGDSDIQMQKVVGSDQVIIKTRTLSVEERQAMATALEENFGVEESNITAESISATVGNEMRRNAILAVTIAVILMLLYIFIRFRDLRFAIAAVIALCHDVLIVLTSYALLRISVGGSFIAVMLTILGYSINSTIVIFDRIREAMPNQKEYAGTAGLVDYAVNMTLTRSILTNITTLSSIVMLYIMGVASIKEFTLPMMVGIVAGALSSVFLTGPLWRWLRITFGEEAASFKKEEQKALAKLEGASASDFEAEGDASTENGYEVRPSENNPNVIRKKKKSKKNGNHKK